MSLIGCRTCASVSAESLEAQPAQFERLVKRICLPLVAFSFMGLIIPDLFIRCRIFCVWTSDSQYEKIMQYPHQGRGGSQSGKLNKSPSVGASPNDECSSIPKIVGLALSKQHVQPMNFIRAGFPNWAISIPLTSFGYDARSRIEPARTLVITL